MISHYVYGRDKLKGFSGYSPDYSKEYQEQIFFKMARYPEEYKLGQAEKFFLYHIQTEEKDGCSVFGKASRVVVDREEQFSFQYLFSGAEQKTMWNKPSTLLNYNFPINLDDYRDEIQEGSLSSASLWKANENKIADYSIQELLQEFQINESKLMDFMYTFLLRSGPGEKVYIMLPDNTKESTDKAISLITKVLAVLPERMAENTGFVTYIANAQRPLEEDYVPAEIRYMFLAKNANNEKECRTTKYHYVFCPGCETGVKIPEGLREIVRSMVKFLLSGHLDRKLQALWDALNTYLKQDFQYPISPKEYRALYDYCEIKYSLLEGEEEDSLRTDMIWANIDTIRSMSKNRTELWKENLAEDLISYIQMAVNADYVNENDNCERILKEYETEYALHSCIEQYFFRKVEDYDQLQKYLVILEKSPELKKKVCDHADSMLEYLLESGNLKEKMYGTVLGIYREQPMLQIKIEKFFEQKIVNPKSFQEFREQILESAKKYPENRKLWSVVEQSVYKNQEKYHLVLHLEKTKIRNALEKSSQNVNVAMKSFWDKLQYANRLNRKIPEDAAYLEEISPLIKRMYSGWNDPKIVAGSLNEAQQKIEEFALSDKYTELFTQASQIYLQRNESGIYESCESSELFIRWPFAVAKDPKLTTIVRKLNAKKLTGDNERQFEEIIKNKNVYGILGSLRSRKNEELIDAIADSEQLDTHVSKILNKLEAEVKEKGKENQAKDCYDRLCAELIFRFPDQSEKVLTHIMQSVYGGVLAMHAVWNCLKEKDLSDEELEDIKEGMRDAIYQFFVKFEMHRLDKKAIKKEEQFLRRLGLSYEKLLKL